MIPVIVPPIKKGICRFNIDFKIASTICYTYNQLTYNLSYNNW